MSLCYTRHEPMPGVHQDVPHLKTECMEAWTWPKPADQEHHHHFERWTDGITGSERWKCTTCDEGLPLDRYSQQADIPPMPLDCPLYCTKHNHEEMGG